MSPNLEVSRRLVAIGMLALSVVLAIAAILLVRDAIPFLMNSRSLSSPALTRQNVRGDLVWAMLYAVGAFVSARSAQRRFRGEL
jgi:hypothetical protein